MLVSKKTNRKQIIIILVVLAIGAVMYFVFSGPTKPGSTDLFDLSVPMGQSSGQIKLDLSIFKNPYFLSLIDRGEAKYSSQYEIFVAGKDFVPTPDEIKVFDPQSGEKLIVAWQNPKTEFQSIRIYRSEKEGKIGEVIAENITHVESWENFQVERDKDYYYLVRTLGTNGLESKNDQQVKGRATDLLAPLPPSKVELKNGSDQLAVEITWQNPTDDDFDYVKIYRSQQKGVIGSVLVNQALAENKYLDQQVKEGETYYYTISSVDTSGNESLFNMVPEGGNTYIFQPVVKSE